MEQSQSPAQPTRKHVVVAVMARRFDSGFEVLLCRRKKDDRYGLMWEFPGGKVEEGETAFEAVERECTEELGIMILDAHLVRHESADYADGGSFRVEFYVVFEWEGVPQNNVFDTMKWVDAKHLLQYTMHSANIPLCKELPNLLPKTLQAKQDGYWMSVAMEEARSAAAKQEVPIGCIIVKEGERIASGANTLEADQDPTAHAEIRAIRSAAEYLGSRRLLDCTLYVTLEPCPMCAGAIVNARIPRVVYAAADPKAGACHTLYSITNDERLNHRCDVIPGICADESAALLKEFFTGLRKRHHTGHTA